MQLDALRIIRKVLSNEVYAPIQDVISCGIVPVLVALLSRPDFPDHRFEAAWCLTNIAGGTHQDALKVMDAVPYFVAFLGGDNKPLQEQALWAVGIYRREIFIVARRHSSGGPSVKPRKSN